MTRSRRSARGDAGLRDAPLADLAIRRDDVFPIYHQIAHAIRWRIGTGAIRPGDLLPSVREGAALWDVNLHTVRHAYRHLAGMGLVESRPGVGTIAVGRAAASSGRPPPPDEVDPWIDGIAAEAEARFGLSRDLLIARLGERRPAPLAATVIECNAHQSRDLAGQVAARWGVGVTPWTLEDAGEPPAGPLVGTRFHEGEIRRRWPARQRDMEFVGLAIDPDVVGHLRARLARRPAAALILCELDGGTGREMARDLRRAAGLDRAPRVNVDDPEAAFAGRESGALLFVAPRRWDEVPPAIRRHPDCILLRHVVDPADMARLGALL